MKAANPQLGNSGKYKKKSPWFVFEAQSFQKWRIRLHVSDGGTCHFSIKVKERLQQTIETQLGRVHRLKQFGPTEGGHLKLGSGVQTSALLLMNLGGRWL